jgi:two-component system, sensor histidine kinase and response regulator
MTQRENRAKELAAAAEMLVWRRTDKMFAGLLIFQWIAGIALALWVTPRTWVGPISSPHVHLWAALVLGAAIISLPLWLIFFRPGQVLTRHIVAAAQMLSAALLIHLTGGRLETHFHVFGSLAFLSFYRDWRVLITATVVVALDHFIRGWFWPQSAYGVLSGAEWKWLEHGAWVAFLDMFLFYSCWQSRREMWTIAQRQAELEEANESVEEKVLSRTKELRESETRFRTLARCLPVGVFQTDSQGDCTFVNDRACTIMHLAPEETTGRGCANALHPDDRQRVLEAWQETVDTGGEFSSEYRFQSPEGKVTWVLGSAVGFRDEAGALTGYLGSILDITERHAAEQSLAVSRDAAESANRAKSEFLANMSHEIRTPMNGILGLTDLLLDTQLSVEQRESMEMVKSSAESLMTVINDILDFSKIEAGRLELDPVEFRLHDVLTDTLKPLAMRADQKRLKLVCRIQSNVPERVVGDPGRLRQVLINLVGNALKFTERGSVEVRATLRAQSPAGFSIRFAVTDTGIGIPLEKQRLIFEAFAQVDSSTTRKFGGTGLGLTISSRLVELMGGQLRVESLPGQGSSFHFDAKFGCPRGAAAATDQGGPIALAGGAREPSACAPATTSTARPLRILLAEDNPVNQRVAQRLLTKHGFLVHVVGNGREALAALEQEGFDLALMDIQMPELDGLEATRLIRLNEVATGRHLPIIAMTAHAMTGDRERCLEAGMDAYVSKPIQTADLLSAIREVTLASRPVVVGPATVSRAVGVFDRQAALERLGGDEEFLAEVAGLFLADAPVRLSEIRRAVAEGDGRCLTRAAHSLKGAIGYLAAPIASAAAFQLEEIGASGNLEEAAVALELLELEVERLAHAVRELALEPA